MAGCEYQLDCSDFQFFIGNSNFFDFLPCKSGCIFFVLDRNACMPLVIFYKVHMSEGKPDCVRNGLFCPPYLGHMLALNALGKQSQENK